MDLKILDYLNTARKFRNEYSNNKKLAPKFFVDFRS